MAVVKFNGGCAVSSDKLTPTDRQACWWQWGGKELVGAGAGWGGVELVGVGGLAGGREACSR